MFQGYSFSAILSPCRTPSGRTSTKEPKYPDVKPGVFVFVAACIQNATLCIQRRLHEKIRGCNNGRVCTIGNCNSVSPARAGLMEGLVMPSLRVSQDIYDRLVAYAEKENRSIANAANHIMEKTLIGYDDIGKVGTNPQAYHIVMGDKVPISKKDSTSGDSLV